MTKGLFLFPGPWLRLLLVVSTAIACRGTVPASESSPPNILFLFADDQRADTIAAWGNRHIRTPNLDRLVQKGFSFRSNYNLGANGGAVCVPSRAMVNSGLSYFRVSNDLSNAKLLGELLGEGGYTTFATGKWHNERPSWLRSFQHGNNIFFGGMSDHTKVPVEDLSPDGELVNRRVGEKFSSELFADSAVEFLLNYESEAPFFAYVAFTAPHDPRQPPEAFRQMYYDRRPPLPANFLPQHPFDLGPNMVGRDERLAAWPRSKEVVEEQLAEYYGMITHLDSQIGRILQAVEDSGRAGNTVVIYAADHGLAVGSHGLLGKQSVYEHSQKCPLIFAGPGIPQGESSAFTYLLDIYPTVAALAEIQPPAGLDGHDLSPVWRGEAGKVRDSVFLAFTDWMRAVRDERFKLIRYPQINRTQLFDLEADPEEMHNLADDPDQEEQVRKMTSMLEGWQERIGDRQALSVDEVKPEAIDLTGREREPDRWQPKWIVEKYF
jgi:arylsulfatase A-like enzyme